MATRAEVEALIKLKDDISAKLATIEGQVKKLESSTAKGKKGTLGLGDSFKKGALQAVGFGTAITGIAVVVSKLSREMQESVKRNIEFESSMVRIETLVGLSRASVDSMVDSVRDLSRSSGRGTLELSEGLFQITSAGLRGKAALDTLDAAAKAARVGLGDVATIADISTSAMNAYGQANITAEEAVGVLLKTVREGKAAPEELASSLGRIIPIASAMGVEFSEVAGIVASMTRVGFSSSEAVTSLRTSMTAILKPTEDAHKALEEVGLTINDVRDTLEKDGLLAALQELRARMSDEQFARFIGSTESLAGALAVTGDRFKETAGIVESTGDTFGVLDEAVTRTAETAEDRAARFSAVWDAAIDKVSDKLIRFALFAADSVAGASTQTAAEAASFEQQRISGQVDPFRDTVTGLGEAKEAFLAARESFEGAVGVGTDAMAALAEVDAAAGKEARRAAEEAAMTMEKKAEADKKAAKAAEQHRQKTEDLKMQLGGEGLAKSAADATTAIQELGGDVSLTGIKSLAGLIEDLRTDGEKLSPELQKVAAELNKIALTDALKKMDFDAPAISAEDLEESLRGVDTAFESIDGIPGGVPEGIGDVKDQVIDLSGVIRDLDSLFAVFGVNATSTLGSLLSSSVMLVSQFQQLSKEFKEGGLSKIGGTIGKGDIAGTASGIAGGIAGIANATSSGSTGARTGKGALAGASAGAQVGGPVGAIVGAAAGAITGFLRGRSATKALDAIENEVGHRVSEGLLDAIRDSGRPAQLMIADIFAEGIAEGTASVDDLAREMGDVFSFLERGDISESEAIKALEESAALLLANFEELGPAGEEQIERIIAAADRLGVEFDGLSDLINSTFAPQTLEEMKESLGLTGEEVRALADKLGIDLQTNLERAAAAAGLTVAEFKALQEAAGSALGSDTAATMEELEALMAATGLSASELADRLNVDVAGGAESLADGAKKGTDEISNAADQAIRLKQELLSAAQAAAGINIPGGMPNPGGGIPSFAEGGFVPRPTLAIVGDTPGGEFITPAREMGRGGGGGGITIQKMELILQPQGSILATEEELAAALEPAASRLILTSPEIQKRIEDVANS